MWMSINGYLHFLEYLAEIKKSCGDLIELTYKDFQATLPNEREGIEHNLECDLAYVYKYP